MPYQTTAKVNGEVIDIIWCESPDVIDGVHLSNWGSRNWFHSPLIEQQGDGEIINVPRKRIWSCDFFDGD